MAMFKVLASLIVATMILNSCTAKITPKFNCKNSVTFLVNGEESISLKEGEYSINYTDTSFEITINAIDLINQINLISKPQILLCLDSIEYLAIGVGLFDSELPLNIKYHYPINESGTVFFFKGNVITIRKNI
jgi:hypothetical protein